MRIHFAVSLVIERGNQKTQFLTRTSWDRLRTEIRERDKETCHYCGRPAPDGHLDHLIPLSQGGSDESENLVWTCPTCNLSKGDGVNPRLLTSDALSEIVDRISEFHHGLWSRKRLTSIRLSNGLNVSRRQYEEATALLRKAGALLRRPIGGYELHPEIRGAEDLKTHMERKGHD